MSGTLYNPYGDAIRTELGKEVAALKHLAKLRRLGHFLEEVDPAVTAAHADFERRWNAIVAEGLEGGFLENDYDGLQIREPEREWVWDETEEEHQQRIAREQCDVGSGGHVVFTTGQRGPSR